MSTSGKIAKNTLLLYFRHVLILFISLYTVRIVLNALGVVDYGIYNVVTGIVTFFSFLSGTMASASQRFFSVAIGRNDLEELKRTFTTSWIIYVVISIVALILLETVGLWFVTERLNVPPERFEAARIIYHISVLMFMASILSTPFRAIIIAHEDMQIFAYVSVVEAILKLAAVFLLTYLFGDKLILYSFLIFLTTIITTFIYISISIKKYKECQFRIFCWDKKLLREIIGFTGWTLFGQLTTVGRNQGVTILLNQVFSPVVVAARAIAVNVSSQIIVFSNNFNTGLYPPIIKSYAANEKKQMFSLISTGSKITFFLMWIFALPFFIEMPAILGIWLKNHPPEAILFTRLALVEVLITSLSLPITTAARAPGKMKFYELTLGFFQISIFVVSWIALRLGGEAYMVFVIAIIVNLLMFIVRLLIVRKLIGLSLRPYFHQVVSPVALVLFTSAIPSFAINFLLPEGFVFTILTVMANGVFTCFSIYFLGFDLPMRKKVQSIILGQIVKTFATFKIKTES